MEKLKNIIKVTAPIEDNDGNRLDYSEQLKQLASAFGGYTVSMVSGGWISESGELMADTSERIELAYKRRLDKKQQQAIKGLICYLFEDGGQEAVFVETRHKSYILNNSEEL